MEITKLFNGYGSEYLNNDLTTLFYFNHDLNPLFTFLSLCFMFDVMFDDLGYQKE